MLTGGSAGKEISGEEGINRLSPSSTMLSFVAEDCVNVVVRVIQNDDIIQNGYGCVGADAQSLLVSSTSAGVQRKALKLLLTLKGLLTTTS